MFDLDVRESCRTAILSTVVFVVGKGHGAPDATSLSLARSRHVTAFPPSAHDEGTKAPFCARARASRSSTGRSTTPRRLCHAPRNERSRPTSDHGGALALRAAMCDVVARLERAVALGRRMRGPGISASRQVMLAFADRRRNPVWRARSAVSSCAQQARNCLIDEAPVRPGVHSSRRRAAAGAAERRSSRESRIRMSTDVARSDPARAQGSDRSSHGRHSLRGRTDGELIRDRVLKASAGSS